MSVLGLLVLENRLTDKNDIFWRNGIVCGRLEKLQNGAVDRDPKAQREENATSSSGIIKAEKEKAGFWN